jgi:hypothetical protein
MLTENDIVFEIPGKSWVIKRRSTAIERMGGRAPDSSINASPPVGPFVWEVHRTFQTTCARKDSTYTTEALARARAEYIAWVGLRVERVTKLVIR